MIQALTPERGILSLKSAGRPERRNQQPQKEEEQRDHRGRRYVIPLPDHTDEVFGTYTVMKAVQRAVPPAIRQDYRAEGSGDIDDL